MTKPFQTVQQVAQLLEVSDRTVRNLIAAGQIRAVKVGRQWRIDREELRQYLEGGQRQHSTTTQAGGHV